MAKRRDILFWHPAVSLLFFALAIGCALLWRHPACLLISLVCGAWNAMRLTRRKRRRAGWPVLAAAVLLTAAINAAFNHRGVTRLTYLPSGNALTLESLLFGLSSGLLLAAVLLWFRCFSRVFTAEKWMYLFAKATPALALLLSMSLQFFEKFRRRFQKVTAAQAALASNGPAKERPLQTARRSFAVMLSWSLESAIVTADSMKSRGYGTARRTAMTRFHFTRRDRLLTLWLLRCGVSLIGAAATGLFDWRYFPAFGGGGAAPITGYLLTLYFLFCMTPLWADCLA